MNDPFMNDPFMYFSLTQRCNWNCWYCDFPTMKYPKDVDIEFLKEIIPQIRPILKKFKLRVGLEGGEIGLVKEEILDYIFESDLYDNYIITTNGTFVKRGYAKKYKNKIRRILLHTKPDISENNYQFERYKDLIDIRVWYVIVVHIGNLNIISEFFKENSDLYWMYPNTLQPRINDLEMMKYEDYKKLYDIIIDIENVLPYCKKRFKNLLSILSNDSLLTLQRGLCCNDYIKSMVNLVKKSIHRCCISMNTQYISLTSDNIESILENDKLVFPAGDPVCNNCIPGWFGSIPYQNVNQIRNIIKKAKK